MADKHLTELGWKTLVVKQKLKDPGLAKALMDFAKCVQKDAEASLKALAAVEKQAEAIKKTKPNEEISAYILEVLRECATRSKTLESMKKIAPNAGHEKEGAEEESEEGLDLKGKLIGALKKVKQRKPTDPPMEALVCKAGKAFAVLFARKVGASQKSELQELLKKESGHKFVKGTCEWGEQDIYTLILESLPSGAAKGLKLFLKEETGLNYKINVRDLAGVVDSEVETESTAKQGEADPGKAFKERFEDLLPRIKEGIAAGGANGQDIKLKSGEAGLLANKKEWAKANKLLDIVETLLKPADNEALKPLLSQWQAARATVIATLREIGKRVAAAKHEQSDKALMELKAVISNLSADPSTAQKVSELQQYLAKDIVVEEICFYGEDIRPPLVPILSQIQAQLAI